MGGPGVIEFAFLDEKPPSNVGFVWTDGANRLTIEAWGDCGQISKESFSGFADNNNYGGTDEDRFFGVIYPQGIKSIRLSNSSSGIEIDHIQYGN